MKPLHHFQMSIFSCSLTCPLIPWTTFTMKPLQHFQLSSSCCSITCPLMPWTTFTMKPLQHFQVSTFSCSTTCPLIPWTTFTMKPLQHFQVSTFSCSLTCPRIMDNLHYEASLTLPGVLLLLQLNMSLHSMGNLHAVSVPHQLLPISSCPCQVCYVWCTGRSRGAGRRGLCDCHFVTRVSQYVGHVLVSSVERELKKYP